MAMAHEVPIHVRSSLGEESGTWVVREELAPHGTLGFACDKNLTQVTLPGDVGVL